MDDRRTEITLPRGRRLDLSGPPVVMGIVNCNEDSFFPPSRARGAAAVERALAMADEGAGIIDLGAESTRPGAAYISAPQEMERLIPVIEGIRRRSDIPLSIDTRKAEVARSCLEAGADIINDISALEDDPGMGQVCGERGAAVILMHKQGTPTDMQDNPQYEDAAAEVGAYLREAADRAARQGIDRGHIILDPGIGFGKRLADNLDILNRLAEIYGSGYPLLVGVSRKGFIGKLTGNSPEERLPGTLAVEAWCVLRGAHILRVHDVKETADLVKVLWAIVQAGKSPEEGR